MVNLYFLELGSREHNNNKSGKSFIEKEIFLRFKLPFNQYVYIDLSFGFRRVKK